MALRFKKRDAGGEGRRWNVQWNLSGSGKNDLNRISRSVDFRAADSLAAKRFLLAILKRVVASTKDINKKLLMANACPREAAKGNADILAEEMIRLRTRFANRRLLRVKNPDVALVQGYGDKILDQLTS